MAAALCACSAEQPAEPMGNACVDYDDPELYADTATLAGDVVPIFQNSCNYNGCHNSRDVAQQRELPLGPFRDFTATDAELDEVHDALVNVDAQLAEMKLVVPGDPAASFLLVKLEYADIGEGVAVGFSSECALCPSAFTGEPVASVKFTAELPWLMEEPYPG